MNDQLQALQQQIVAAVQDQLTLYSQQVAVEVQRLRDEILAERNTRALLDEQLRALASGMERAQRTNTVFQEDIQKALEDRLIEFGSSTKRRHDELNQRLDRVVDEANKGMAAAVESAARPVLRQVEHRQDKAEADLAGFDKTLRKFDEQAGRMVAHINGVSEDVDTRMDQLSTQVTADVEARVASLSARLDEVSAQAARHQSEVSNIVGQRVDESETRLVDKIATAEARVTEHVGTRIAEIDAYVGRVSVGLDENIVMINDRIAEINARFDEINAQIREIEQSVKEVDAEAMEEMKEKVSSAAGEAMLVRIEMERFQTSVGESLDKASVRLTEVETQLQDQSLDTETAVQLERLEEVERALIALDPSQFVRVDDATRQGQPAGGYDPDIALAAPSAPLTGPTNEHAPPSGERRRDDAESLAPLAEQANAQQ